MPRTEHDLVPWGVLAAKGIPMGQWRTMQQGRGERYLVVHHAQYVTEIRQAPLPPGWSVIVFDPRRKRVYEASPIGLDQALDIASGRLKCW